MPLLRPHPPSLPCPPLMNVPQSVHRPTLQHGPQQRAAAPLRTSKEAGEGGGTADFGVKVQGGDEEWGAQVMRDCIPAELACA